jgi:UDP-N-acetylglucosamine--N-acetylmuramyl-(pentapeptide) pyrophosphoryl-undecaprenol N-acetylglucosamine transferase
VTWEGNLVAGRSVRATARLASALAVSFEETCTQLPGRCFVTGTPIRSFAGRDRASARAALGFDEDLPLIFVFGGSQAVRRMNRAVAEALPNLVERAYVLHMTGEPAYAEALRRRESLPQELRSRYRPYPFLRAEMTDALLAADLLVGRAGSSTLAEASALGLPMVVVPYPHASAHQVANARALAKAGAARIVADQDFDARALIDAAHLLDDQPALDRMRLAAHSFGRPGAAAAVAELVLALAERAGLPAPATIERMSRAAA